MKILPILDHGKFLKIRKLNPGDELPSGQRAKQQRSVYMLSEAVCGAPGSPETTPDRGIPGSLGTVPGKGVPGSLEPSSLGSGNSVTGKGELSSAPLCDRDLNNRKNDRERAPAHASKDRARPETRLEKTSRLIREDKPLHPEKFLTAYNEAIKNRKIIPYNITLAIPKLVACGLLALLDDGQISSLRWDPPTPLLDLLNQRDPDPDNTAVATLLEATTSEVEL